MSVTFDRVGWLVDSFCQHVVTLMSRYFCNSRQLFSPWADNVTGVTRKNV